MTCLIVLLARFKLSELSYKLSIIGEDYILWGQPLWEVGLDDVSQFQLMRTVMHNLTCQSRYRLETAWKARKGTYNMRYSIVCTFLPVAMNRRSGSSSSHAHYFSILVASQQQSRILHGLRSDMLNG